MADREETKTTEGGTDPATPSVRTQSLESSERHDDSGQSATSDVVAKPGCAIGEGQDGQYEELSRALAGLHVGEPAFLPCPAETEQRVAPGEGASQGPFLSAEDGEWIHLPSPCAAVLDEAASSGMPVGQAAGGPDFPAAEFGGKLLDLRGVEVSDVQRQ